MKSKQVITNDIGNEAQFTEVIKLITVAQRQAYQAVNTVLMELYWQIGEYISHKIEEEIKQLLLDSSALRWMQDHNIMILKNYSVTSISDKGVNNLPSAWRLYCLITYYINIFEKSVDQSKPKLYLPVDVENFTELSVLKKHFVTIDMIIIH